MSNLTNANCELRNWNNYSEKFEEFLAAIGGDQYELCQAAHGLRWAAQSIGIYSSEVNPFIEELVASIDFGLNEDEYELSDDERYDSELSRLEDEWAVPDLEDGACAGCQWLTGEYHLPCTVNPINYGLGCFDYETV